MCPLRAADLPGSGPHGLRTSRGCGPHEQLTILKTNTGKKMIVLSVTNLPLRGCTISYLYLNHLTVSRGRSLPIKRPTSHCHIMPDTAKCCQITPNNAIKCQTMPNDAIQCHSMPNNAKRCHPITFNAKRCHPITFNTNQCHSMPNDAIQCQMMPNNAKRCQTMPIGAITGHNMP